MNLFQRQPGQILPSYQNFVRPQLEIQRFAAQQQATIGQLSRDLRTVQLAQEEIEIPSGVGAGFRVGAEYFGNSAAYFRTHQPRR